MNIAKAADNTSTVTELKRIASAYVIDYRGLNDEEIRAALKKTAPQYYYQKNIETAVQDILLHADRGVRLMAPYILQHILLQADGCMLPKREMEDRVLKWEQSIIDRSNEDLLKSASERRSELDLFQFVVSVAWDRDNDVSVDEKNLLERIRQRLKITLREYHIIEAKLGKFPHPGNTIHTHQEVEEIRRLLQTKGLLFAIRDNDGTDFDLIPEEIAEPLRTAFGMEIRDYGYREMLKYKAVRSKTYLTEVLKKAEIKIEKSQTLESLSELILEQVSPKVLLGGISPRDGLPLATLSSWCGDLGENVSGSKEVLIDRIIRFYDKLYIRSETVGDEREVIYQHYEAFAKRDREFLRQQQLADKDIEIERKFEAATNYIFEKILGHKPLNLVGSNHADGALSYREKVIYWDNKSKESPVNLKDHLKQFDGYIRGSEQPVAGFLVIGPDFTPDSSLIAMQYQVENGTPITMITAEELKTIAEAWLKKKDAPAFPLGYLLQPGRFNPQLVAAIF
jgi:hypothetical protein